jgi:hypothetical protein
MSIYLLVSLHHIYMHFVCNFTAVNYEDRLNLVADIPQKYVFS